MIYHNQLTAIIKASGLSQEELARCLEVSFATLNAWVNSRATPRAKAQAAIERLYLDTVGIDDIEPEALQQAKQKAIAHKTTLRQIMQDEKILNKLILHLTYHTNTIEGSTMTLGDTKAVLFSHQTLSNRSQREQAEARNHQAALAWLLDELEKPQFVIDEPVIHNLHVRLMNGIISDAGRYRTHGVRIMGTAVATANHLKIHPLIRSLVDDLQVPLSSGGQDPISQLAATHANFEKIHPFSDGNGRVGRLIMLAQALKLQLIPPIIPKEKRYAYYKYLETAQTKADFSGLEFFIAETIVETQQLLFGEKQHA